MTSCHPVYPYPDTGTYSVLLTIDGGTTYQTDVQVVCPQYKIQFEITQNGPDTICLHNQSMPDSTWLPGWLSTDWRWIIGSDTIFDSIPCVRVTGDSCDLVQLEFSATNGCGTTTTERMQIILGYVPDKPLRSQQWTCSPGHTPIEWSIPNNWGQRDTDQDGIENNLDQILDGGGSSDILVYYYVPKARMHQDIRNAFENFQPPCSSATGIFDRISKYITVASYRGVNQAFVNCLLGLSSCTCPTSIPLPISLITSDNPMPANHNILGNPSNTLSGEDILMQLGFGSTEISDFFGQGSGVGIGTIGAGREFHKAFGHLPNEVCPPNLSGIDHNYQHYTSFVNNYLRQDCHFGLDYRDIVGDATAKLSLLTSPNSGSSAGICPLSNFFFLDVADQQPGINIENKVRKSDILEAFDWAISNKSSSVPLSILICDFSFDEDVDSNDAISAMVNIASSYGLAVFTSVGATPNGLGAPGNASQSITVGGAFFAVNGPVQPVADQSSREWIW